MDGLNPQQLALQSIFRTQILPQEVLRFMPNGRLFQHMRLISTVPEGTQSHLDHLFQEGR
jgi:hypothetical protein